MDFKNRLFAASAANFNELAVELFNYQYQSNGVYRQYCDALKINTDAVDSLQKIPFLPISFFKTHKVTSGEFEGGTIFESSGTTGSVNSKHYVKDLDLYRESFTTCFEKFYGPPRDKCILGLLPSYLERKNSSLVMMVESLIAAGENPLSGFYLYDHEKLHRTLMHNELLKIPTLLIGVTYALLDFAEKYPMQLRHTIVMETGGMKGRREEMTRQEVHAQLMESLGLSLVHSEYGMTELLSQAYSKGDGIFHCPGWMKVLLRDEDDPFKVSMAPGNNSRSVTGVINIIDLANIYSCAFIATDDIGRLHANESFEVLGRIDSSDIRGCSLMAI
ncbi:MAG: acyl transferase [Chitinophagaceae bacterium]|nr:acyl transferase [Chitinophagaceae bacterium]